MTESNKSNAELLAEMRKVIQEIYRRKEELCKMALTTTCPACGLSVKKATWVISPIWGKPLIEKLLLVCDRWHEWYWGGRE
jgi:hypothetical protein